MPQIHPCQNPATPWSCLLTRLPLSGAPVCSDHCSLENLLRCLGCVAALIYKVLSCSVSGAQSGEATQGHPALTSPWVSGSARTYTDTVAIRSADLPTPPDPSQRVCPPSSSARNTRVPRPHLPSLSHVSWLLQETLPDSYPTLHPSPSHSPDPTPPLHGTVHECLYLLSTTFRLD